MSVLRMQSEVAAAEVKIVRNGGRQVCGVYWRDSNVDDRTESDTPYFYYPRTSLVDLHTKPGGSVWLSLSARVAAACRRQRPWRMEPAATRGSSSRRRCR